MLQQLLGQLAARLKARGVLRGKPLVRTLNYGLGFRLWGCRSVLHGKRMVRTLGFCVFLDLLNLPATQT